MNEIDFSNVPQLLHFLKFEVGLGTPNSDGKTEPFYFSHLSGEKALDNSHALVKDSKRLAILITFENESFLDNAISGNFFLESELFLVTKFSFGTAIIAIPSQKNGSYLADLDCRALIQDSMVSIRDWLFFCFHIKEGLSLLKKSCLEERGFIPPGIVYLDQDLYDIPSVKEVNSLGTVHRDIADDISIIGKSIENEKDILSLRIFSKWSKATFERERRSAIFFGATIVGGQILSRQSGHHNYGQEIYVNNGDLSSFSKSIMDYSQTVSSNLINLETGVFFNKRTVKADLLLGKSFLIGSIHNHFGHFLIEGCSRLDKALEEDYDYYIIFEDEVPSYALKILEFYGIPINKLICLGMGRSITCESLAVVDPAYFSHHGISKSILKVWDKISSSVSYDFKVDSDKVFLSRSGVVGRRCLNEASIEKIALNNGYQIIKPHTLSIEEQISLVNNAKTIAGCVGSQMYLAAFSKSCKELKVIAPSDFCLPDDFLISSLRNTKLSIVLGSEIGDGVDGEWDCNEEEVELLLRGN